MPSSPIGWDVFDSLPKPVREAIANSSSVISPHYVEDCLKREYIEDLVRFVQELDRQQTRKLALEHYDKDHPEAQ